MLSSKIQRPKREGFHERRKIRSTGLTTQTYIPSYCMNYVTVTQLPFTKQGEIEIRNMGIRDKEVNGE